MKNLDLKKWDTRSAQTFYAMFDGCESLTVLNLTNFNTSNAYNFAWMFSSTWKLENIIGMENWDVSQAENIEYMFNGSNLINIRLPDFTNSKINSIASTFKNNKNVQNIDLTRINMNNINNLTEAFKNNTNLKTIYVQEDYKYKSANYSNTFFDCLSLVGGAGTKYDPTFIDSTAARIDGGPSNPGYFTAISQKPIETGAVVNVEGSDYIVIEQKNDNDYLMIAKTNIENIQFNQTNREDGLNGSTYEGSDIDKYLENTWYNTLSTKVKQAIKENQIKQVSYSSPDTLESKQDTGPNGQTYNTINRHVFLSSVEEFSKVVDIKDKGKMKAFLDGKTLWTRDNYITPRGGAEILYANSGHLYYDIVVNSYNVRPSFVIDLSKVNYAVTGSVNYK